MTSSATPEDAPRLSEGMLLGGRYRVGARLGRGGMGEVYAADVVSLQKPVAIKVLRQEGLEGASTVVERFLREARASSTIKHPNVVDILDTGEDQGHVYYVMERLYGHDLARVLQTRGKLPWSFVRGILLQAARGLRAAHARGIIHRDVKPANIFLIDADVDDEEPRVKVLDFGIAKIESAPGCEGQPLTRTAQLLGTAWYMAPEQASTGTSTACSDVYSLGVVAYQLLTGQVPFDGPTSFRVLYRHLRDTPVSPRDLEPSIPPAVEALILRALAKEPAARFPSMHAMVQALAEIPTEDVVSVLPRLPEAVPAEVETQSSTVPIPRPPFPRRRWVATAWGSLTLVGLFAAGATQAGPWADDGFTGSAPLALSSMAPTRAMRSWTTTVSIEEAQAVIDRAQGMSSWAPLAEAPPTEAPGGPPTDDVADDESPSAVAALAHDATPATTSSAAPQGSTRPPPDRPPAPTRSPTPAEFDARVTQRLHRDALDQCALLGAATGTVTVSFTVLSNGQVGAPRTQGKAYGTPVGQCLELLIATTRFAPGPLRAVAFEFDPSRVAR